MASCPSQPSEEVIGSLARGPSQPPEEAMETETLPMARFLSRSLKHDDFSTIRAGAPPVTDARAAVLWSNILKRIPLKSLLSFRTRVNKAWTTMLMSLQFTRDFDLYCDDNPNEDLWVFFIRDSTSYLRSILQTETASLHGVPVSLPHAIVWCNAIGSSGGILFYNGLLFNLFTNNVRAISCPLYSPQAELRLLHIASPGFPRDCIFVCFLAVDIDGNSRKYLQFCRCYKGYTSWIRSPDIPTHITLEKEAGAAIRVRTDQASYHFLGADDQRRKVLVEYSVNRKTWTHVVLPAFRHGLHRRLHIYEGFVYIITVLSTTDLEINRFPFVSGSVGVRRGNVVSLMLQTNFSRLLGSTLIAPFTYEISTLQLIGRYFALVVSGFQGAQMLAFQRILRYNFVNGVWEAFGTWLDTLGLVNTLVLLQPRLADMAL